MAFKRKCGQCALPSLKNGICPVFNQVPNLTQTACPMFEREIIRCGVCNSAIIPSESAIIMDSPTIYICDNCRLALSSCAGCKNGQSCAFENDPRPDKYIMQTIRQGGAILQTQVRNPEAIRDTCQNGCKCFSEEFGCLREMNYCGNHNTILGGKE